MKPIVRLTEKIRLKISFGALERTSSESDVRGIGTLAGISGTGKYKSTLFKILRGGHSHAARIAAKDSIGGNLVGQINGIVLGLGGSEVRKICTMIGAEVTGLVLLIRTEARSKS
jgi:hypothetical protein